MSKDKRQRDYTEVNMKTTEIRILGVRIATLTERVFWTEPDTHMSFRSSLISNDSVGLSESYAKARGDLP
ncbi:hypothetical protein ED388_15065 [Muribaculaceae bacterium Isolate-007 (NCI)]|nr:hypothetical protein EEL42_08375 [Muribaculaceae bacterium Isolate-100 (HZI)]RXE63541.1 hypothetical protein ED388_15065 [Muribaculaceae bacterium Isolate-007 (NCI)]